MTVALFGTLSADRRCARPGPLPSPAVQRAGV